MSVQPYLFFNGRCEEALEFYRSALGAEVEMLSRFKDAPEPGMTQPGMENKVMHASFRIGETLLMASDGRCDGQPRFEGGEENGSCLDQQPRHDRVRDRDPVNLASLQLGQKRSRIHDNGGKVTEPPSYAQTGIRIANHRAL